MIDTYHIDFGDKYGRISGEESREREKARERGRGYTNNVLVRL